MAANTTHGGAAGQASGRRLTHVDGGGEDLGLGEHGEAIAQLSHVVAGLLGLDVLGLHVLEGHSGAVLVSAEGGCASVDGVENSVNDAGGFAADGELSLLDTHGITTQKERLRRP